MSIECFVANDIFPTLKVKNRGDNYMINTVRFGYIPLSTSHTQSALRVNFGNTAKYEALWKTLIEIMDRQVEINDKRGLIQPILNTKGEKDVQIILTRLPDEVAYLTSDSITVISHKNGGYGCVDKVTTTQYTKNDTNFDNMVKFYLKKVQMNRYKNHAEYLLNPQIQSALSTFSID